MKWYTKCLCLLAVATLLFLIGGMVYVVKAKYSMNDYAIQIGAAFNAATLVNATDTYTDADHAVVAAHEGQRAILVPENYKALSSYLRRDHAMPLFSHIDKTTALHVSICNQSHLYIQGDKDGDGAMVRFETAGDTFVMHVRGGDLWDKILKLCMEGTHSNPNIAL